MEKIWWPENLRSQRNNKDRPRRLPVKNAKSPSSPLKGGPSTAGTACQSTGNPGSDFVIIFLFSSRLLRAPGFADRFLFLKDGEVFAAGTRDIITPELIGAVYGLPVTIVEINGMPCVVPGTG